MIGRLLRRIRFLVSQRRLERELTEEMEFHREQLVRHSGVSRGGGFGNATLAREDARVVWIGTWVESLWQDVRYAARLLRRYPRFSVAAILCTALGIGSSTTMFGIVNGLLLHPLPYPDADRLVAIHSRNATKAESGTVSWADVESWRQARSLSALGVWSTGSIDIADPGSEPERVQSAAISPQTLVALRVQPFIGRNFDEGEHAFGRHRVAILSHALWQRRYGGDPGLVGRSVRLAAPPAPPSEYVVVGIMPPGPGFPDGTSIWTPLQLDDDERDRHGDRRFISGALGRLADGATLDNAVRDVGDIARRLQSEFPADNAGWNAEVVSLQRDVAGNLRTPVLLFQGAALLVLLIGCANVASLLLARTTVRYRELAVRAAIGAGRGRLFRHVIVESCVLAAAAGALGLLVSAFGSRAIALALPAGTPSYIDFSMDRAVVAFGIAISFACAVLFGSAAAWQAGRPRALGTLRAQDERGGDRQGRRLRQILVVAEVALSTVLLIGASLVVRSSRTLSAEIGMKRSGLLYVALPTPAKYEGARREAFFETLASRIKGLPGVTAVGWSAVPVPLSRPIRAVPIRVESSNIPPGRTRDAVVYEANPSYFDALGVRLLRGRSFGAADRPAALEGATLAAVVNDRFARDVFGTADPIGARITTAIPGAQSLGTRPFTIVGVVADFRDQPPPASILPSIYVYVPFGMSNQRLFVATTLRNPSDLAPTIRSIAVQLDPTLPPAAIDTVDAAISRALWREELYVQVLGVLASLALLLALTGIYAAITYSVSLRIHEFGIRLALGAAPRELLLLVLREGAGSCVAGIALGLAAALTCTRLLVTVLYGVRPTDPLSFAGAGIALAAITLLASALPARRAAAVDPVVALKVEV